MGKKCFRSVAWYHIWNLLLKTTFTVLVSQKCMCLKFRSGNTVWEYRFHFRDHIFGFCYLYFSHLPFLLFFCIFHFCYLTSHFVFSLFEFTYTIFIIWSLHKPFMPSLDNHNFCLQTHCFGFTFLASFITVHIVACIVSSPSFVTDTYDMHNL